MNIIKDLKNKHFGRWTIKSFSHTKKVGDYTYQMWNCLCECGNERVVEGKSLRQGTSVSCGCFNKERIPKGKNHYRWQDKNLSYLTIHKWLIRDFGKANKCEGKECRKISKCFDWSLLEGKNYERKRENFIMLCRSCHKKYDMTEETKKKIIKNLKNYLA